MSDQKICPTCGTEYPLSERFCPRDGTALRSANVQADLLGQVVADRYHILKKLGEGGMGTVYLAEHVKMGRKSALKVMNPGMNTDPDAIARFNREASNASRLSHPNICGIYDFGETPDGLIYLAMEFIEGTSLTSLVEKGGSLPAPRAASIVHQTADALQVAHDAGIVHRDLKPDNIMVAKNRDGSDLVKVVDFGIAKASSSDAQKVTKTGMVVGTPEYMSPEQLAGDKLDGRSDIYSLALVAFNCLTGALPFAAETQQEAMIMRLTDRPRTLAEVAPEKPWPEALQTTLDKALARDTADRYSSAAQFGRDFAAAIADMPLTQAIDAKTSVIGAVNAGGATAKVQVPSTRVAAGRPSEKTAQMEAPPGAKKAAPARAAESAPEKKSVVPLAIGGVGGLALVGFAAVKFGLLGGAAPAAPTDSGSTLQRPESTATPANPNPGPAAGDTARLSKGTTPPAGNPTKVPGTSPGTSPGNPVQNPQNPNTSPGNTPTGPSVMTRLEGWLNEVQAEGATKGTARRVLGDLEPLQPTLSGLQLAESHFVAMMSYVLLEDEEGACRAARAVKARHNDRTRLNAADQLLTGCP